ncbi:hypothetical protein E1264_17845 [Actinomadura sp. KC216]|uniref:hypothetical protein n=1 Tax=Actinomadura sp. KC216 TaxID=2530370 RepID=UPI0010488F3A|nr:hypothetical protein [Actinomadura sp. KC216]TDB86461.1 hypothetical protein E1264_17845 [Actinomadura sp. KC216]
MINRHARALHVGDVIRYDPDHQRDVRYRVSDPPVRTRDGEYALAGFLDLDTSTPGIGYWRALADLPVEPAPAERAR